VADKIDVAHWLEAHHADQCAVLLVTPEYHAGAKFRVELSRRHVGLVPSIGRDHATIDLGRGIDDREDRCAFVVTTAHVAHDAALMDPRQLAWSRPMKRNSGCLACSAQRSYTLPHRCRQYRIVHDSKNGRR
jgi:hypothetical protein